ncbi:MAG: primosomal protein N' [Candidatus Methylomirabilia bacterium]
MIADVVFNLPRERPFSYRVPPDLAVTVGQRVRAPLKGKPRVGLVVACREGSGEDLKALDSVVEPGAILSPTRLELARWIAAESCSSLGSTCTALLPPPLSSSVDTDFSSSPRGSRREAALPQLLTGGDREERLMKRLVGAGADGGILLLAPEIEDARAWAERLHSHLGHPVVRLDSGRPQRERFHGWVELARGAARIAVGTRSALLAPVPASATLVLVDEHDRGHRPPGHPRIHSREAVLQRCRLEGAVAIMVSATPSVESWWKADSGRLIRSEAPPAAWPKVSVVDVRGLRSSPLSPALRGGIRRALGEGGQVMLLVTKISSSLACGECGFLLRCATCGIPLAYSRVRRECSCHLCGDRQPAPETCRRCRGRQLAPLGWGAERVVQAVRQTFPGLRVARYDSEALTPAQARQFGRQWRDRAVRLVVGTRQALKALDPTELRLVGVITPDHLLRLPDFRAAERAFAMLWGAAERVGERGRLIVQTQHPDHYALRAVATQEQSRFYKPELEFRADLGYPPFRRLCVVSLRARQSVQVQALADECSKALERLGGLTVFSPASTSGLHDGLRWRIVVKGGGDLPERLRFALSPILARRRAGPDVVEVEMDPLDLV